MYSNSTILIRKYVKVLQKDHTNEWDVEHLSALEDFKQLIGPRSGVLSYLRLDCIAEKRKYDLIMKAIDSLNLTNALGNLVYLLKKNKHLALLPPITKELIINIKKQLHIEDITIYSAQDLSDEDQANLEQWIKKERNATIVRSSVVIKPELIAGFRIEGNGFMCDYSVNQQLNNLQYLCINKGHIS